MFGQNRTQANLTSITSTTKPFYPHARRPQVIRMRDLSPASRARVAAEYYQSYDAMTGVRIAATLGGLITLFALFLFYKSRCKPEKAPDPNDTISPSISDTNTDSSKSCQEPCTFSLPTNQSQPAKKTKPTPPRLGSAKVHEVATTSSVVRPPLGQVVKTNRTRTASRQSIDSDPSVVSSSSHSSAKSSHSSLHREDTVVVASSSARPSATIPPFVPNVVVVKCHGDKVVMSH